MGRRRQNSPWLAGVAALLLATPAAAQQTGSVTGRVMDASTLRPLSGAQIVVQGTNLGTLANEEGRYLLPNVPVGSQTIRVVLIGYEEMMQEVDVSASAPAVADFRLTASAISLDAVVVTATGEQRKKTLSNAVAQVDAAQLTNVAPISGFHDLLQGRVPSVSVLPSAGTTGAGSRIRIRGSSSISLQNDPVIYIDGVRVESGENSLSVGTGGQSPSRLNDINPEDIESIEIVKGPSAATLYGTDAANGVIRITTKRGQVGATSWQVWTEQGILEDQTDFPDNMFAYNAAGDDSCFNFELADGLCTRGEVESFNPLEDPRTSPFTTGRRQVYGLSASGGNERLNYYVSGEFEKEDGVFGLPPTSEDALNEAFGDAVNELPESQFNPNKLDKVNLRANFGGQFLEDLNVRVSTGYVSSDLNLPQNDNNVLGLLPSGLLGLTTFDPDGSRGYGFFFPEEIYAIDIQQQIERFTGSVSADYQPGFAPWLSARATTGMDVVNRTDLENVPRGRVFFGSERPVGRRAVNHARIFNYSVDGSLSANFDVSPDVTSRSTAGVQWWQDIFTRSDASGYDIPAGPKSLNAASNTEADEQTAETKTFGVFFEQEFGFWDRLFVNGAVRGDDNSSFGSDFDFIVYPKAGISYVVSEESWFPTGDVVNSFRVRGAWGRSGQQPGTTDAIQFFNAVAVTDADGSNLTGATIGELGNPDLEPEQSEEFELGLDAGFLQDRVNLGFTFYDKTTTDLLIEQPLPPSAGVGEDRFVNLGEVNNKGFELELHVVPVRTEDVQWDLSFAGSTNDNELLDLGTLPNGDSIPPIIEGTQRFVEGYPLGAYWDFPVTFNDADGNGLLSESEVTIGDEEVFLDEALPTREASISTSVSIMNRVQLHGLVEYRGGHSLRNLTDVFRCDFLICDELSDENASLERQAAGIAESVVGASRQSEAGFIEDASFWKLRELGVSFFIPEDVVRRIGGDRATLTLTGRNLATWTDYGGIDPEVNQFGQANFLSREFLTQPPVRHFTARLKLNF